MPSVVNERSGRALPELHTRCRLLAQLRCGVGELRSKVDGVEQKPERAPGLGAMLGAKSKQDDMSFAETHVHQRRMSGDVIWAKQPPRSQRIAVHVTRDGACPLSIGDVECEAAHQGAAFFGGCLSVLTRGAPSGGSLRRLAR